MFKDNSFRTVRIETITQFEVDYEKKTDTVWFQNHNVEDCIAATEKLGIEHIHLQTKTIDFLHDPRLKNVKGITMQFEIENIMPLFRFQQLTHLGLPENIQIEFNFSMFENLIYLGGSLPKKYINFHNLIKLKYTYLFDYRKKNLNDFANCSALRKLSIYSLDIENLTGLSSLSSLTHLSLENCRKLVSLEGIGKSNINLQVIDLRNCKRLRNVEALKNLPNLRQLLFYGVYELDSLDFLHSLDKLETLTLHPTTVGVRNKDYYPLVETLKRLNKLGNLKGWRPLKDYLNKQISVESTEKKHKSELELLKENVDLLSWTRKREYGLKQYSKKNCKKAEVIILDLINELEKLEQNDLASKEEVIKQGVIKLNQFNSSLNGSFIETTEREELCNLFDNIADAVGLNVHDYPDGIASKWREW